MRPLTLIAVALASCTLPRSDAAVTEDVLAHLRARYGEDFVVTRVSNQSNAGTGFQDLHRYEAHPAHDPALRFDGMADYRGGTTTFSDTLRCARAAPPIRDRAAAALRDAGFGVPRLDVRCTDARLPVDLDAAPSPAAFHWQGPIVLATDPAGVAEAADRAVARITAAGIGSAAPSWRLVDPALAPGLGALTERDDLAAWELGRPLHADGSWRVVAPSGPFPSIGAALAAAWADAAPPDAVLSVRVAPGDPASRDAWASDPGRDLATLPPGARLLVDVRARVTGPPPAEVAAALRDRIRASLPSAAAFVHVARWDDTGAKPTFRDGVACAGASPCARVDAPLLLPAKP